MSPILFNVVADMLAILIARAKEDGPVGWLITHLVKGGVPILQYADDILYSWNMNGKSQNYETGIMSFRTIVWFEN